MEEHVAPSNGHALEPECDRAWQLLKLAALISLNECLILPHAELRAHKITTNEERVREAFQEGRNLLQSLCLFIL